MDNFFKRVFFLVSATLFLSIFIAVQTIGAEETTIASIKLSRDRMVFNLKAENNGTMLSVNGPGNTYFMKWFDQGIDPVFNLKDSFGELFPDGTCTYELSGLPILDDDTQKIFNEARAQQGTNSEATFEPDETSSEKYSQSGTFYIEGGKITGCSATARLSGTDKDSVIEIDGDQVILDDLIVDGSICAGMDCVNGESFGFDTIRLKENNLRIRFQDTSNSASFPTNDWQITANDSSNGGLNKFSIDDIDHGTTPFTIEAGAHSHSLYIDDYDRVGLGTSTPVVELHIKDNDTPTVRLEQDGSGGWTPQTWDVAGNEANFFIRDATNGSKLPFRIQPSTPSNTLYLQSDGNVGIGTSSPSEPFELETTGEDARLICQRTDGATAIIAGSSTIAFMGTPTDHPLRLVANGSWRMQINQDNSLEMRSGATCTIGGVWTDNSSRELKENIRNLSSVEAHEALNDLTPVKYYYKAEKDEEYLGFIAEDVPDLVATKDRKHLVAMDMVAVLTKVVQEQQKTIENLTTRLLAIENKINH